MRSRASTAASASGRIWAAARGVGRGAPDSASQSAARCKSPTSTASDSGPTAAAAARHGPRASQQRQAPRALFSRQKCAWRPGTQPDHQLPQLRRKPVGERRSPAGARRRSRRLQDTPQRQGGILTQGGRQQVVPRRRLIGRQRRGQRDGSLVRQRQSIADALALDFGQRAHASSLPAGARRRIARPKPDSVTFAICRAALTQPPGIRTCRQDSISRANQRFLARTSDLSRGPTASRAGQRFAPRRAFPGPARESLRATTWRRFPCRAACTSDRPASRPRTACAENRSPRRP